MSDTSTRARWPIYVGIAVILVFIAAMSWQYVQTYRLRGELTTSDQQLQVARNEATLAAAAIQAQQGNYEVARQLASTFFTGLQGTVEGTAAELRPTLATILGQRDATITMLSRSDPQSASVLVRMFTQYRTAVHGPDATAPMAAPAAPPAVSDTTAAESAATAPAGPTMND